MTVNFAAEGAVLFNTERWWPEIKAHCIQACRAIVPTLEKTFEDSVQELCE